MFKNNSKIELKSPLHLHHYLNQYGWTYDFSQSRWSTGWHSNNIFFPLFIELNSTFLDFTVLPVYSFCHDQFLFHQRNILNQVVELNKSLTFFKLSLETHHLVLHGQVFRRGLDYENFSNLLGILAYCCDEVFKKATEGTFRSKC